MSENIIVEAARREAERQEEARKAAEERDAFFRDGKLGEGLVHYILSDGPSKGQHRPALVVRAWRDGFGYLTGTVNLQVFTDSNPEGQYNDNMPSVMWVTSSAFDSSDVAEGCWHWIEGEDERAEVRRVALHDAEVQAEIKAAQKGKTINKKKEATS